MGVSAERRAARGDLFLFGGCLVLSLAALALPQSWAEGLTSGLRSTILRPLVILQERAATDRLSRFQLPGIEAQRDSLAQIVQGTESTRLENRNLRGLLGLSPQVGIPYFSAELLHQSSAMDERMLLIGIGSDEGVQQFDPVVTADGLLGYIWKADQHSAVVLTWLHPEFRAHAVTQNESVMGMISPARLSATETFLELRGVALRDTIAVGTIVYTSSLGEVYPRGIPIGTVVAAGGDSLSYERIYQVIPFVNPGTATHALVLKATPRSVFIPIPAVKVADTSTVKPLDTLPGAAPPGTIPSRPGAGGQ